MTDVVHWRCLIGPAEGARDVHTKIKASQVQSSRATFDENHSAKLLFGRAYPVRNPNPGLVAPNSLLVLSCPELVVVLFCPELLTVLLFTKLVLVPFWLELVAVLISPEVVPVLLMVLVLPSSET